MELRPEAPTSTAEPALFAYEVDERLRGVRGWLLLFCLSLTVFTPVTSLVTIVVAYSRAQPLFGLYPRLMVVTLVDIGLGLGLVTFGVVAGLRLWRVRPGAVRAAKAFLLTFLAYQVVGAILPFQAGLPSEANGPMLNAVAVNLLRGTGYVIVWYAYLNRSRRVATTYGGL